LKKAFETVNHKKTTRNTQSLRNSWFGFGPFYIISLFTE